MQQDGNEFELFIGIDWGSQWHEVCVIGPEGSEPLRRRVRHSGDGLAELITWLAELDEEHGALAVAIEVPHGPVVETVAGAGFAVFSINPKQSDRFRDRHTVAGAKDDRLDAFVLADALRTDLPKFRRIVVPDSTTVQLREITRWYEELNADLRRLSNRLRDLLQRYFPSLLELCSAADEPWLWDVLEAVGGDPAKRIRVDRVRRLLRRHGKRAITAEQVIIALRATPVRVADGTTEALALRVAGLLPQLTALHSSRVVCKERLAELVAETGRTGSIIASHPGAGTVVTGVLMAEAHQALEELALGRLRAQAGVAPVTRSSGRTSSTIMRRACNHRLRWAVRQWAFTAARCDPYAKARYTEMRTRGLTHERALRGLGDRLLARLIAALRDDTLHDAERNAASIEDASAVAA